MTRAARRVSVGLPVYNGEQYLDQAVQSLLAQTFTDFELVICDNASTDGTESICRKYAASDGRVIYHRNPENIGAAPNHNLCYELSSGEYFRWAAYDDLCAPEYLERCVAVLDACPSAALCYPKTRVIDAEGSVVGSHDEGLALLDDDPVERHKAFCRRFRKTTWCDEGFGLMRSEVLRKTRLLGTYNSADHVLLQELALLGEIHEVPEYLFCRRIHPLVSMTANSTPEALANWLDPANGNRIVAPFWRLVYEHFRAVKRTSLKPSEKIRCYSHLMGWFVWWRRGLARETLLVAKALSGRQRVHVSP